MITDGLQYAITGQWWIVGVPRPRRAPRRDRGERARRPRAGRARPAGAEDGPDAALAVATRLGGGAGVDLRRVDCSPSCSCASCRATRRGSCSARWPPTTRSPRCASQMGLNDPIWVQYWHYVRDFFTGDWGFSYSPARTSRTQISTRLPASIELGLWAFGFAFVAARGARAASPTGAGPVVDGITRARRVRRPRHAAVLAGADAAGDLLLLARPVPRSGGPLSDDIPPPPKLTGLITVDALLTLHVRAFSDAFMHLVLPAICPRARRLRAARAAAAREPARGRARAVPDRRAQQGPEPLDARTRATRCRTRSCRR